MKNMSFVRWIFILTITWMILHGTADLMVCLSGIIISFVVLKFIDKYLIGSPFHEGHHFKFYRFFKYFLFMIKEIYLSGFEMIIMILTHDINPAIVVIETDLEEEYQKILLANSITLTPGTITADWKGNTLKVLWINKTTEDPQLIRESISKSIEERLRDL